MNCILRLAIIAEVILIVLVAYLAFTGGTKVINESILTESALSA
jgi:hypothetical protein